MSLKQRGHAMRTFDFAPFYRSTVGFDRLFSMLDQVGGVESTAAPGYPPYNSNVRVRTPKTSRWQSPASPVLIFRSR